MPLRRHRAGDSWEFGWSPAPEQKAAPQPRSRTRRTATTLVFTTLFFSGAALTAVAGDKFASVVDDTAVEETTSTEAVAQAPAPAEAPAAPEAAPEPAAEPAPAAEAPAAAAAPEPAPEAADDAVTPSGSSDASAPASAPASPAAPAAAEADASSGPVSDDAVRAPVRRHNAKVTQAKVRAAKRQALREVLLPPVKAAPEPEVEGPPSAATIWLNSALPDPTPPAKRLSPAFARRLTAVSRAYGIDWAFVLGIVRAKGETGTNPADAATLRQLARRLADLHGDRSLWAAAVAYGGSSGFADRAIALTRYDRAVGLDALVHGLESAKRALGARLLADPQVSIYEGGRNDIATGRVDVRVLALIAYLHEAYGEVTVSCLISGHRLYARPGVISAHISGHAVDIAALGGKSILGNQEPGGLTEQAVHDILLLPGELMPKQVISLLGLGGPSFPLANHYDHIHVGY